MMYMIRKTQFIENIFSFLERLYIASPLRFHCFIIFLLVVKFNEALGGACTE